MLRDPKGNTSSRGGGIFRTLYPLDKELVLGMAPPSCLKPQGQVPSQREQAMHPLPEPMSSLGGTNPDLEEALNPQQETTSKKHLRCNVLLLSGMAYVNAIREHKTIG